MVPLSFWLYVANRKPPNNFSVERIGLSSCIDDGSSVSLPGKLKEL